MVEAPCGVAVFCSVRGEPAAMSQNGRIQGVPPLPPRRQGVLSQGLVDGGQATILAEKWKPVFRQECIVKPPLSRELAA